MKKYLFGIVTLLGTACYTPNSGGREPYQLGYAPLSQYEPIRPAGGAEKDTTKCNSPLDIISEPLKGSFDKVSHENYKGDILLFGHKLFFEKLWLTFGLNLDNVCEAYLRGEQPLQYLLESFYKMDLSAARLRGEPPEQYVRKSFSEKEFSTIKKLADALELAILEYNPTCTPWRDVITDPTCVPFADTLFDSHMTHLVFLRQHDD